MDGCVVALFRDLGSGIRPLDARLQKPCSRDAQPAKRVDHHHRSPQGDRPSSPGVLFHAIRADLLRRIGREADAALAYDAAIARTENSRERDFLRGKRQALADAGS